METEPTRGDAGQAEAIDMLLFCPNCGEQHVDEAKPDVCETCGHYHSESLNDACVVASCSCKDFTAWLNPPYKSHRCIACNHVWRPADVPTNGVLTIKSKGERDGNPRPRYFYTAKDYQEAVADATAENATLRAFVAAYDADAGFDQSSPKSTYATRQAVREARGRLSE